MIEKIRSNSGQLILRNYLRENSNFIDLEGKNWKLQKILFKLHKFHSSPIYDDQIDEI
jgi:hypothetical protein